MLGFTSPLMFCPPPCLSDCIDEEGFLSMLIALRVSSNLKWAFQKQKVFRLCRKRESVLAALIAYHVISLVVIFIEVVSLFNHFSTSKV